MVSITTRRACTGRGTPRGLGRSYGKALAGELGLER